MLRVLLPNIFHSKIVDDEGETDGTGVVRPETWRRLALAVDMLGKLFFEQQLGDDTSLPEAIHPLLYFTVDVAVGGGFVSEVVMCNDVVGHVGDTQEHVFKTGHRGV
jgi:hypothetical protein